MRFYSGFSLKEESVFFADHLCRSKYSVAGFSYGAIKAAAFADESSERIDTLQLFSPAFFQNKPEKFKRLQMMAYKKDKHAYLDQFIRHCFAPYDVSGELHHIDTKSSELDELLNYTWEPELLGRIADKGTHIKVYFGGDDKIIDAQSAREFFKPYATVYFIKKANHFLRGSNE